jgi:hypothetical protein
VALVVSRVVIFIVLIGGFIFVLERLLVKPQMANMLHFSFVCLYVKEHFCSIIFDYFLAT